MSAGTSNGAAAGEAGAESGGAGGESAECECSPFEFCRKGSCVACSDIDGAEFAAPKKLGISGRYPRPAANGGLFYADDGVIYFAFAEDEAPLAVVGGSENRDTAPLLVPGLDALLPNHNFFFLRSDDSGSSLRGAYWINSTPPMLTKVSAAPSLLASPDGLNYSLAISGEAARAWWRTTRTGLPGIVSASLTGDGSDITAVAVDIAVGKKRCRASEMDPTAWVTPDGRLLLFRETVVDAACAHPLGFSTDLYAVSVDPASGIALGPAAQLGVFPGGNARDSDPAFGADCSLYFSSDAATSGMYELYRAERLQ
jgi:hypothetical protein